jgi:hypothetical protein
MSWMLLILGCVATPSAPTAWVAPFDGQTSVAADFAPRIDIALAQPDGWPLDLDIVRVVDLTTGEPVTGIVAADTEGIWFTPDFPWAPDTDYAWTVDAPEEQPRGPSSVFPPVVVGTASFSTRPALEVVAVGEREDGTATCAVWSRPAELAELSVWSPAIDGAPTGPWAALAVDDPAAERGLVGPGVACVPGVGSQLRLESPEQVLSFEISGTDPATLVLELRRWSP